MILINWILTNVHWLAPTISLVYSELLGWKSGAEASITQVIWNFIKKLFKK